MGWIENSDENGFAHVALKLLNLNYVMFEIHDYDLFVIIKYIS